MVADKRRYQESKIPKEAIALAIVRNVYRRWNEATRKYPLRTDSFPLRCFPLEGTPLQHEKSRSLAAEIRAADATLAPYIEDYSKFHIGRQDVVLWIETILVASQEPQNAVYKVKLWAFPAKPGGVFGLSVEHVTVRGRNGNLEIADSDVISESMGRNLTPLNASLIASIPILYRVEEWAWFQNTLLLVAYDYDVPGWHLHQCRVQGKEIVIERNRVLRHEVKGTYLQNFQFSPQGNYLTWSEHTSTKKQNIRVVASVADWSQQIGLSARSLYWISDIEWCSISHKDAQTTVETFNVKSRNSLQTKTYPRFPKEMRVDIALPTQLILSAWWYSESEISVDRTLFMSVPTSGGTPRKWWVKFPVKHDANHFVSHLVSPDGSKIAWVIRSPSVSDRDKLDFQKFQIWVTHLDGSNARLVSDVSLPYYGMDHPPHLSLQWRRDPQSLAFLYEDALWALNG